jgi:hypothetical protein
VVAVERGVVIGIAAWSEIIRGAGTRRVDVGRFHPSLPRDLRSLLYILAGIAQRAGSAELLLWVLEDNVLARRTYAHLGFEWTGERKPIHPRPLPFRATPAARDLRDRHRTDIDVVI